MAETKRDYYEVLGVERDADAKAIKRAFLKKARVMHPDVSDDPDAEAKFKEINEAYSVLSDETKRANYDRFGDPNGPAGFGGMGGMDDIFGGFGGMADIFSDFFGGGAAAAGRARTHGRDMSVTLRLTLQQAATGIKRTISYDRLAPCEDCHGTGSADGHAPETCLQCHGTGHVTSWQHTILGRMQTTSPCPQCNGTGEVVDEPCETCDGQGRAPSREKVTVEVPAGVRSGQRIVIEGAGEAGVRGDAAGDLVVTIDVAQEPDLVRQGDDLVCAVTVDAFEAMLGATLVVDGVMPDEKVVVEVPAGTQHGAHVVVRGKGMPHLGDPERRGALVCIVDVTVPEDLTAEQRAAVTAVARERGARIDDELPAAEGEPLSADNTADKDADDDMPEVPDMPEEAPKAKKPRPKKRGMFGKRKKKRS